MSQIGAVPDSLFQNWMGESGLSRMDAVHGYFPLALSEDSPLLTTFLLQQGKFGYFGAPMGLNTSPDEWCCHSDRIATGLPWAKRIVGDIIIWAPTLEELQERATIILERCRDLNKTISLKKLELGKVAETSTSLNSMSSLLQERASGRRIYNLTTVKRLQYVAQSMKSSKNS